MTIKVDFSEADIEQLHYERFHHPHPWVQLKMEALLLKSQGVPLNDITRIIKVSPNTFRSYLKDYLDGGIERLKEINFNKPQSDLLEYRETIEAHLRKHPPKSAKEAAKIIEDLTGIKRSTNRVRIFLKSIGMKFQKTGMVPAKADIEKQEEFKKKELEPRLEEAKKGKRLVFFVDAAHFVYGPFLGYLWSFVRIFVKAPSGRKRWNVLGAINAITHELHMICNTTYINSEVFCFLLYDIAERYSSEPITIILDNAKYQKCSLVQYTADMLNIELLYIPPYSPNLNLIERLWKFIKKQCLNSEYYSSFHDFKNAIDSCLKNTHTTHKKELDSLLSLKFQTFKKAQLEAA